MSEKGAENNLPCCFTLVDVTGSKITQIVHCINLDLPKNVLWMNSDT